MAIDRFTRGQARFGPFEVDLRTGEVRKHGLRVRLQDQRASATTEATPRRRPKKGACSRHGGVTMWFARTASGLAPSPTPTNPAPTAPAAPVSPKTATATNTQAPTGKPHRLIRRQVPQRNARTDGNYSMPSSTTAVLPTWRVAESYKLARRPKPSRHFFVNTNLVAASRAQPTRSRLGSSTKSIRMIELGRVVIGVETYRGTIEPQIRFQSRPE